MPDAARTRFPAEPGAHGAARAAAPVVHGRSGPARVLALQRAIGNAGTRQLLARWPLTGEEQHQHTLPDWLLEGYADARKARDAYVASGKKGPITYDPSKRNKTNYYGGFDVEYDPALGNLKISLRGAVEFVPGMVVKNGRAVAKEPSPKTLAARDAINALPAADRATEVNKWAWSKAGGPDAADEADFLTKFETIVESQWSEKHAFHCERAWWQDLKAAVKIDVEVREAAKAAKDHMKVLAYKVPKGQMIGQANVTRPGSATGAFANQMTVNSSKVEQRTDRLLELDVTFNAGTDTPTAGSKTRLRAFAADMPNPKADATVETPGVSVKVQGPDPATRKTRFDAIAAELTGAGVAATRIAFVDDGPGTAAMLTVGSGAAQTSVAHESGHMFGLDDEYTGGGEYGPGKVTEHTKFVKDTTGLTGVMHAKSDSIMSEGRIVRPQHYATFLDALRLVSGIKEWEFGPGVDAVGPRTGWDDRAIWGEPMGPF